MGAAYRIDLNNYTLIKRAVALQGIANRIASAHVIGLDLETEGFDPMKGRIRICSLNIDGFSCVIDLFETQTFAPVAEALNNTSAVICGQNLKFDQKWLWFHHRVRLRKIFDTMRASYIYYNGLDKRHDLYSLYDRELNVDPVAQDLGGSNWSGSLTKEQYDYAAEDILMLPHLRDVLRKKLIKDGLVDVGLREMAVVFPEARMELNGYRVDGRLWLEQAEEARLKEYEFRLSLLRQLPSPGRQQSLFANEVLAAPILDAVNFDDDDSEDEEPEDDNTTIAKIFRDRMPKKKRGKAQYFNVESNKHVLEALQKLGLRDENGKLIHSTSEIVLAGYAANHPVVKELLLHREWATRCKMFGPEYLKHIHPITGRIHGSLFAFTGAGRYAMRAPNLLQLPRSKKVRACFRPLPGRKLIIADLSQAELRIMAQLANDHELIKAYRNGVDIHTQTAEMLSGKDLSKLPKAERDALRQLAKAVNFGLIYGLGAAKFVLYARASYGVVVSLKEAEEIIKKFFDFYKGVKKWQQQVLRHIKPTGEVWTLGKRRRFLDPKKDHNAFLNCLDRETEALTQRGWVRGFDLKADDVLLSKNADTGVLEWQALTGLRLFPDYRGPVVEFRTRNFNAVSTPEHRWLVTDKHTRGPRVVTTDTMSRHGDHRIHRNGLYQGASVATFTDDFVELLGWALTDGSVKVKGQPKSHGQSGLCYPPSRPVLKIYQSIAGNPQKVARIDALFERLGADVSRYATTPEIVWRTTGALAEQVAALVPDRVLTMELLQRLTAAQAKLLFDVMVLGDGSRGKEDSKITFSCSTEEKARLFQILVLMTGRASTMVWRDMSKYTPTSPKMSNTPKMNGVWVVSVLQRDTVQVREAQRTERLSTDGVWCPMVPNTFFVARREGSVFITGNTPDQGTGADGLKEALIALQDLLDTKYSGRAILVLSVHDEVVIEADDDPELLKNLLHDLEMVLAAGLGKFVDVVPVKAEGGYGDDWTAKG